MVNIKLKSFSWGIFTLLVVLIFIRPFLSGLAYPALEIYYQNCIIFLAIASLFINKKIRFKNPYELPILLIFLAHLVSFTSSVNIQNSIKELIRFITFFSAFFLVSQASDTQKKSLIKIISLSASIIGLYAIYQYFWGYQGTLNYLKKINSDLLLTSSYAKDILITKRAIGTFPSPNILGGYLIIVLFLSLSLAENNHRRRIWYPVPFLITAALILTKSLGAWLSFVSAFIIFFLASYKSFKYKKMIMLAFFIFTISVILFIMFSRQERLLDLNNPQNSITQRLDYWRTAIAVIKDRPLLGIGPGNFKEMFLYYKVGTGTDTKYTHNIFLQYWAELGLLGLVGIILLIITFVKRTFQKSKYLFLAGLAFIIHNLIDNTYFIAQVSLLWWVILGLAMDKFNNEPGSRRSLPS